MIFLRLFTVILGLAVEVKSDGAMMLTGRRGGNTDPYKVAQREGWTAVTGKGTKANRYQALLDCITLYLANDPDKDFGASIMEALRDGDYAQCVTDANEWREAALAQQALDAAEREALLNA